MVSIKKKRGNWSVKKEEHTEKEGEGVAIARAVANVGGIDRLGLSSRSLASLSLCPTWHNNQIEVSKMLGHW